jgi:hypothetical protein
VATYTNSDLLLFLDGIVLASIYRAYNIEGAMFGVTLICIGVLSRSIGVPGNFGLFENFIGLSPALTVGGILALEPAIRRKPQRRVVHNWKRVLFNLLKPPLLSTAIRAGLGSLCASCL